jgi:hypothetical protein
MASGFSAFAADIGTQNLTFNNPILLNFTLTALPKDVGNVVPGGTTAVNAAANVSGTSNSKWTLTLKGDDFVSGGDSIPIGRLEARKGTDAFTPVTNAGIAVASSPVGGTVTPFSIDYQLKTLMADPVADGFNTTLTYTISGT